METILKPNLMQKMIREERNIAINNSLVKLLIINIYVPNDRKEAIRFIEEVFLKIHKIRNVHADEQHILGGDINTCMTKIDCLNRAWNGDEKVLANNIVQNNKTCQIIYLFR
jgi:exonuclease III